MRPTRAAPAAAARANTSGGELNTGWIFTPACTSISSPRSVTDSRRSPCPHHLASVVMAASRAAKVVPASPEPEALFAGPAGPVGPAADAAGAIDDASGANGNAAADLHRSTTAPRLQPLESAPRTGLVSGHSPTTTPMAATPDLLGNLRLLGRYRSGDRANREKREKKYAALLTAVTGSSKRAKLMSAQGVLFAFTFMMSTFETSNR